jgi:RNA polymerase sigma-70 factor (ECF subfamily)
LKRGGGVVAVPIDGAAAEWRYERGLAHAETPERLYDRQWCLTLLEAVLDDLRGEYETAGKGRVFDRLKDFLTGDEETHAGAARDLGMSAGAVKVAVHRLRRRYRETLRRRVADTVDSSEEVEDEIRHLLRTLGPSRERL